VFELWTTGIGSAISLVLAVLKLCAVVTFGWLGVALPVLVAIAIVLVKNGFDVSDLLPG